MELKPSLVQGYLNAQFAKDQEELLLGEVHFSSKRNAINAMELDR